MELLGTPPSVRSAGPRNIEPAPAPARALPPEVVDREQARAGLALTCVEGSQERSALASWWPRVRQGDARLVLVRHLARDTLAVFRERHPNERRHALGDRALGVLERVLAGQPLNATAIDLGVSNSTVSIEFKHAATALGLGGKLAQLPLAIAQLWHAHRSGSLQSAPVGTLPVGGVVWHVLLIPRPDLVPEARITPAELQVCRLLLDGFSHAEISSRRATSLRTTANQLSSAFRKLGVSGRLELVAKLAAAHASQWAEGPKAA